MAGYIEFSKSANAAAAEDAGRFPATKVSKLLGLPVAFVREAVAWASHGEWHHTSKFYNPVPYYDVQEIQAWMEGDAELVAEHGIFRDIFEAWNAARKIAHGKPAKAYTPVTVTWLEWGGTRSHPRAFEQTAENATVIDAGGKFVTVKLASGATFKKGRETKGFEVRWPDGKRIWL